MKRTRPTHLIGLAGAGLITAYLGELWLVTSGSRAIAPPWTLALTLAVVAVLVLVAAWPVRRAVRGERRRAIDPLVASRVVILAKASSLTGAVIVGVGAGALVFFVTRSVPAAGPIWMSVAVTVGAGAVLAAGLIAESWCTLPPQDPEADQIGDRVGA
ncbi:MAG TPA: DUF3180 domain-containing protein [Candidatus Lumbricidophila sp.]|nr:DUF3180 domain-containing protein [Candidatus Lumbricidophila sp.]